MRPFAYQAPASLAEAVSLLAEPGKQARPLAGGTDLLVQLRQGLYDVDLVVDIKKIPELNQLSCNPDDGLVIGAAVPCARIYEMPEIRRHYPALIDAAAIIGGVAIQGRATLGGNLCNASPSGDSISAMIALNATCTVFGPGGSRTVSVAEFCTAPRRTVLKPGELLVSIEIPFPQPNSGAHYLRFTPRREMDIAVAGVGAWVALSDDQRTIEVARLALAAVGPTPIVAGEAADTLAGQPLDENAFDEAARLAQTAARPITDVRGTVAFRRHLVGVLVKRALTGAVARAKGGVVDGQ